MIFRNSIFILSMILLVACDRPKTQTKITSRKISTNILITDSLKSKIENDLSDIIKSNSLHGDTAISGKYIAQGKYNNGDYYITVKTKDSTITLTNLSPIEDSSISKLKKEGDNITIIYNTFEMVVKFLALNFENGK